MSEENRKIKKEHNLNDGPGPTKNIEGETVELSNDYFTICPYCCSSIEILLINENNSSIEYKCLKDNIKYTQSIKEYLEKIKECRINNINELKYCKVHNNIFVSYCYECKMHLCDECLKSRKHINHKKSNMIEVQPIKEELEIIDEVINDYKIEIKNLEKEQKEKKDELEKLLNKEKDEEKNNYNDKFKYNKKKEEEDLKRNKKKYLSDLEDIKKEYENKIKLRKNKYLEDNEITMNKYKLKNEKLIAEYNLQIDKLVENYKVIIQNLKYETNIEKNENMLRLNEIIYNSYKNLKNFYNSSLNINNLLLFYSN